MGLAIRIGMNGKTVQDGRVVGVLNNVIRDKQVSVEVTLVLHDSVVVMTVMYNTENGHKTKVKKLKLTSVESKYLKKTCGVTLRESD